MMRVVAAPQFARAYAALPQAERRLCDAAVEQLPAAFGQPHLHSGLRVRALRRGVYECRANHAARIVFTRHGQTLLLYAVGNHDAIQAWLRNNL